MASKAYQTVVQRYFTPYYVADVMGKLQEDHCILQHSNRICLVTIAPSHKLLCDGDIARISFQSNRGKDRTENKVSGKGKKGGQQLEHNSLLCEVECANGNKYHVRSCIQGKLIEVNEELLVNPNLLSKTPENGGFVAVILPRLKPIHEIARNLLNADEYQETLNLRQQSKENSQ